MKHKSLYIILCMLFILCSSASARTCNLLNKIEGASGGGFSFGWGDLEEAYSQGVNTTNDNIIIGFVTVELLRAAATNGTLIFELWSDNGGNPNVYIDKIGVIDDISNNITVGYSLVNTTIEGTAAFLPNTQYHVVYNASAEVFGGTLQMGLAGGANDRLRYTDDNFTTFNGNPANNEDATVWLWNCSAPPGGDTTSPIMNLTSPLNNAITKTLSFRGIAVDNDSDSSIDNVTLWINMSTGWGINETNTTCVNASSCNFQPTISDGAYLWNMYACDNSSNCNWSSANRTVTIDLTSPVINLTSPANDTQPTSASVTFFYNVTELNSIINCSLYLNNTWNQSNITAVNITGNNQFPALTLAESQWNWTVGCEDGVGNIANATNPFTFAVNLTIDVYNTSNIPDSWSFEFDTSTTAGVLTLFFYLALCLTIFFIGLITSIPAFVIFSGLCFLILGFIVALSVSILFGILTVIFGIIIIALGGMET